MSTVRVIVSTWKEHTEVHMASNEQALAINFADLTKRIKEVAGPEARALPHSTLVAVIDATFAVVTSMVRETGEGDTKIPRLGQFKSKSVIAKAGPKAGTSVLQTHYHLPKAASENQSE